MFLVFVEEDVLHANFLENWEDVEEHETSDGWHDTNLLVPGDPFIDNHLSAL